MKQILYTALVTPFDAQGENIDYKSLEKLVRAQEKANNGIVLMGSTGEGLSLCDHERQKIVEFVLALKPQTQILVGVPSFNLRVALNWLSFCRNLPIDGYLMTTPMYTKPGVLGQSAWFEKLLDHAAHKAMLYNIPGRSGIKLHAEAIKNLKHHERLWALKDSSGSVDSLIEYQEASPNLEIFCGDDYLMPAAAAHGARGLVSVASNAWPQACRRYVALALDNIKFETLHWWQAGRAFSNASNPIPVKALLKDLGYINSDQVRLPLSIKDLPSRQILLALHEKLHNWDHHV
jgi:4-hydroxy-tetrahydrodipicolinate synthase